MTRLLAISADRSKRGILVPGTSAHLRQKAYAEAFGTLDCIGFSLSSDGFESVRDGSLRTHPTRSFTKLLYGLDAIVLASRLPWPDVVSAQDPFETGLGALWISRFVGKPLHIQVHTDFLSPAYARHSVMNRLRVMMAGRVLKRAARIRVVSERIKQSIEKRYRIKVPITVLPIFADVARIRGAKPTDALIERFARFNTRILFVGRLEKEKHPCLALEAFAQAAPADSCLIIVGSGSELEHLNQQAKQLGIEERVFFEGETDSAPYYHFSDLLLVTSRYEGYGLVLVEALAAGKPVLSTDVGVAREVGAIIASEADYAAALRAWFADGPREGILKAYPYADFADYVRQYCADIKACAKHS